MVVELPFEDDEAKELFEKHLLFRYNDEEITELDLVGKKQENPFLDLETHRFILDYTEKNSTSD